MIWTNGWYGLFQEWVYIWYHILFMRKPKVNLPCGIPPVVRNPRVLGEVTFRCGFRTEEGFPRHFSARRSLERLLQSPGRIRQEISGDLRAMWPLSTPENIFQMGITYLPKCILKIWPTIFKIGCLLFSYTTLQGVSCQNGMISNTWKSGHWWQQKPWILW